MNSTLADHNAAGARCHTLGQRPAAQDTIHRSVAAWRAGLTRTNAWHHGPTRWCDGSFECGPSAHGKLDAESPIPHTSPSEVALPPVQVWQDGIMQDVASAIVQVVTVSDVPTIVLGIVTGVVGIAGVAGAIVSAKIASKSATKDLKLSIAAGNKRADMAEKRKIYASCLAALTEMETASGLHRVYYAGSKSQRGDAQWRLIAAQNAMHIAASEADLIAPPDVRECLRENTRALVRYNSATIRGSTLMDDKEAAKEVGDVRQRLYEAMRKDLGELVESS
jgi:hypothetical protein